MNRKLKVVTALCVILCPLAAHANAGTALMWASALHLVFGNAVIGVVEGLLLAGIFKTSWWRSVLILIPANYVSAWLGGVFIIGRLAEIPDITILNLRTWFSVFVVLAFIVTLIIEYPFFRILFRKKQRASIRSIKAAFIIHGISYLVLFGWYWLASGTSMMTKLDAVAASEFKFETKYELYFIAPDGNEVIRTDLAGSNRETISMVDARHRNDRLFVRNEAPGKYDLLIYLDSDKQNSVREKEIMADFSELAPVDCRIAQGHAEEPSGTWFNFGPVPSIADASDWTYQTGFWPVEGISGDNKMNNGRLRFSLETPFQSWTVRNAVQLENNRLVFQLGDDQICMLDPLGKKIALIARGKGPVVAKKK